MFRYLPVVVFFTLVSYLSIQSLEFVAKQPITIKASAFADNSFAEVENQPDVESFELAVNAKCALNKNKQQQHDNNVPFAYGKIGFLHYFNSRAPPVSLSY